MKRRDVLTAALTTPAFALAGAAMAQVETPIMTMFREWQPLTAWLNSSTAQIAPEDEFDRADDIRMALERRMMDEPARDMRDVLAKMLAWTHYGEDDLLPSAHLPQLWAEARALIG